ncbi:hypothetical protein [Pseudonocardia sp.]|uniref:hypothetical protein n=1 Tax=Pseudonocardia sp. TaxID=60912 RepID=UPI0031FC17B5
MGADSAEAGGTDLMIAAATVFWVGVGIGALGLVEDDLYVIGLVIMLIGGIGILVRITDWLSSGAPGLGRRAPR